MLQTRPLERKVPTVGTALVAALAAICFVAVFAARHYSSVSAHLGELVDAGRVVLLSSAFGMAILSGVLVAFLRLRSLRGAFLAGVAVPAFIFAADPPLPGRTETSSGKALSLVLAPVSVIEDLHRATTARETEDFRKKVDALEHAESRLREVSAAQTVELARCSEERQTASESLERTRAELLEISRRCDAASAELAKLRADAQAAEEARKKAETALAAAEEKARAATAALEKVKAQLVKLQVRAADRVQPAAGSK
jgi:hypothetical protein